MITKRKMIIPIFDYGLTVIIYDDWDTVKHLFDNDDHPPHAITDIKFGKATVGVDSKSHSKSIVHEAEHVKDAIWEFIGYRPQPDNDEVDAYLIAYIYSKILQVFEKHDSVNK